MDEEYSCYTDSSYLESLARTWKHLRETTLKSKIEEVIEAELDLALLAANKAKSEILKSTKDNIKPLKGA